MKLEPVMKHSPHIVNSGQSLVRTRLHACFIACVAVCCGMFGLFVSSATGQSVKESSVKGPPPAALARWQAMRFGLFIHWGPVSLKGTEIGWSRGRAVPIDEYDQLYRRFNPTRFDANAWVATAKDAGMKYLVITSKHHDGFCIWDSQYTDYDILATPLKRDILRELSTACKQQDVMFCTYHSVCDWYHPDYPLGSPGGKTKKPSPNMDRYVKYLHDQTAEIIRKYGPIGIMWFDGEWESPWTHAMGIDLYKHIRAQQSDILINNRVDKGRRGMQGMTKEKQFLGDYATPEQQVGGFNRDEPWESCITICRQWAWKPNDEMKSLKQCIDTLIQVVGGDGNLLLNVGPMPDGRIEPRQVARLREIGQWLDQYGVAVYGTRGGPYKPGHWGASTCKGNKIFLFITRWPDGSALRLPQLKSTITSVRTLSGGKATAEQSDANLEIALPKPQRDPIATVVELTVDGQAFDIEPMAVPERPAKKGQN